MFDRLEAVTGCVDNRTFFTLWDKSKGRSGFINHHFISYGLKNFDKVVLVGLDQSFGHYHGVAMKVGGGLNLHKLREQKKLVFIDVMSTMLQDVLDDSPAKNPDKSLEGLCQQILDAASEPCFLIIDHLSILSHLGYSTRSQLVFTNKLLRHTRDKGGKLLVSYSSLSTNHTDSLATYLHRTADLSFLIEDLKTGRSKDVSGYLCIATRDENGAFSRKDLQYRLEERTVKVFAPGTSGAVL